MKKAINPCTVVNAICRVIKRRVSGNFLVFLDGITSINQGAFAERKLTRVTIPNSVVSIGESAFFF